MTSAAPTKAVILARGLGTRMRAAVAADLSAEQSAVAASGVKAMMPVGDGPDARPFVDHVISALADAGLTDVCLVIGPEHGLVRDFFASREYERVRVSFAIQDEPRGTADAVRAARDFAGGDRFVMINSDNYYPVSALAALVRAPGAATVGFDAQALVEHSNIPAERIAAFAILDVAADGTLAEIVEKPAPEVVERHGPHARLSMNCFLFTPGIFAACDAIAPSVRGEYEITDAVRALIAAGEPVTVVPVAEGVLDMSSRADVAQVAEALGGHPVRL